MTAGPSEKSGSAQVRNRPSSMGVLASATKDLLNFKLDGKPPLIRFKQMPKSDLEKWASILCHQVPPKQQVSTSWSVYRKNTKAEIAKLPDHLRDSPTMWHRFMNQRMDDETRATTRELCSMHHRMNRKLVRSTLGWIKKEIELNIPGVMTPLVANGLLDSKTAAILATLQDIGAMWLDPTNFEAAFRRPVKQSWEQQADRCAACVLARFAGSSDAVCAFKAGLIGRALSTGASSRRMQYVNFLIQAYSSGKALNTAAEASGLKIRRALNELRSVQHSVLGPGSENDSNKNASQHQKALPQTPPHLSLPPGSPTSPMSPASPVSPLDPSEGSSKPDVYAPIPWRSPTGRRRQRDQVSELIDHYRRTIYEPHFGQEDHAGFEEELEDAPAPVRDSNRWPTAQHEESIATMVSEQDRQSRTPYERLGEISRPADPYGSYTANTQTTDSPIAEAENSFTGPVLPRPIHTPQRTREARNRSSSIYEEDVIDRRTKLDDFI
ncbi:hypothetical protein BT63DRAFT_436683 [Microthyrium microscopicum]|uniref:Uncharacterized protein n=1 Tax=Microthyrium microscopicum TaxID=703497 RepID=A0A6A6UMZ0_9PEZI|nr:hypothetical protein BT63DRAFT_436683 [Microthyrium microscopicum]